jgi:hypothetical protein
MRVTLSGHAGLYVESGDERVLVDPILRDAPLGGTLVYHPARALDLARMPVPTVLVLTHAHLDHYDPPSLRLLRRDLPVVVPRDDELAAGLRSLGFADLHPLGPWEAFERGGIRLMATPSSAPFVADECGVVFEDARGARLWHMSDAEVDPAVGRRILADVGRMDAVSVKYQPQARAFMNLLFSRGAELDKAQLVGWLEAACAPEPRLAFPYSNAMVFSGEDAWVNQHIFPFSEPEIARLLERRLASIGGRSGMVMPGDVLELRRGEVEHLPRAASFVRSVDGPAYDCAWEPIDEARLFGLDDPDERRELEARLGAVMAGPFPRWLARGLRDSSPAVRHFVEYGVGWQLVVHAGGRERICYGVDFGAPSPSLVEDVLAEANYFVHVSGRALLRALRTDDPAARAHCLTLVPALRLYEKILHVRDGQFWTPPVGGWDLFVGHLAEPLTTFLCRR